MIVTAPVHVWLPDRAAPVVAGAFSHDARGPRGQFSYSRDYIAARLPRLAPEMPVRAKPLPVTGGSGIFPLFLDAGPDTWGRHLLAKRSATGQTISEIEALIQCPTDGVGNIALGELTAERLRVLTTDEFLGILAELEAGGRAGNDVEEQVLDAAHNGTSLGGTKPKLTVSRNGVQYLAKFPAPGDSRWLPHIECAMLKLAAACGIRTCDDPEVWRWPDGRAALLVKRFDRQTEQGQVFRRGYISAHALLRLDLLPQRTADTLAFGPMGFSAHSVRKSYVAFAADMARWCGGQARHLAERQELWRRIVFNALIRNLDDHTKNHGLICEDMIEQRWQLSPAFDMVPAVATAQQPALSMAYRFVQASRRNAQGTQAKLVARIDVDELLAAAIEHYGYRAEDARLYLLETARHITLAWRRLLADEGVPAEEIRRHEASFSFAARIGESPPTTGRIDASRTG